MLAWLLAPVVLAAACSTATPAILADVVVPDGFPPGVPVPEGSVTRAYTGSAETGFVLNVTTDLAHDDLVRFVTDAVAASDNWALSPADAGLPVLPGYDADWVIFTRGDQVVAGPAGTYEGGIGIAGSDVNILLSPTVQPRDGIEPPVLPARAELPRPTTLLQQTAYSQGKINVTYQGGEGVFEELIDAYRARTWEEQRVIGYGGVSSERNAIGVLGTWRVNIRDFFASGGGPIILEFEDLTLSFP
jgi:hypothetical protein